MIVLVLPKQVSDGKCYNVHNRRRRDDVYVRVRDVVNPEMMKNR